MRPRLPASSSSPARRLAAQAKPRAPGTGLVPVPAMCTFSATGAELAVVVVAALSIPSPPSFRHMRQLLYAALHPLQDLTLGVSAVA